MNQLFMNILVLIAAKIRQGGGIKAGIKKIPSIN
jgi:hypothetical protein